MAYSSELEHVLNRGYRYALSLTQQEDDAYDLVQSAYMKICEGNKPLIFPYLAQTIRNIYIDHQRRNSIRQKWFQRQAEHTNGKNPAGDVEPILEQLLSRLKDREREVLLLSVVEEYTAKEIGELMDIPRNTILSILSRTKKKLRNALMENKGLNNG